MTKFSTLVYVPCSFSPLKCLKILPESVTFYHFQSGKMKSLLTAAIMWTPSLHPIHCSGNEPQAKSFSPKQKNRWIIRQAKYSSHTVESINWGCQVIVNLIYMKYSPQWTSSFKLSKFKALPSENTSNNTFILKNSSSRKPESPISISSVSPNASGLKLPAALLPPQRGFNAQTKACCLPPPLLLIQKRPASTPGALSAHFYLGRRGAASHSGHTSLWRPSPDSRVKAHETRRLARPAREEKRGRCYRVVQFAVGGHGAGCEGPRRPGIIPLMPVTMRFDWRLEHPD